jgi:hypothetical protein
MHLGGSFLAALMLVSSVVAGIVPSKCDSCALIVADLNVCVDVFDDQGHCDPAKACPCWEKAEDSLISAALKLAIDDALLACVCVNVG